ncbi:MAG: hypothetical protein IK152_08900 [Lachnospiraceae bacterium]|nr:hypothetical protein [Lachnospiraceae bacterium]
MTILSLTDNRRELVEAIASLTGNSMRYQGPPTFSFSDGIFTVTRDGSLEVMSLEENVGVLKELAAKGLIDNSWDEERQVLSIDLPMRLHTPTSLVHLLEIIWGKEDLINKAVGAPLGFRISKDFIDLLTKEPPASVDEFLFMWRENGGEAITVGLSFDEEAMHFTGFPYTEDGDRVKAFTYLAAAIHDEALVAKRVKKEKSLPPNEKYYFRVWLIRIGFGGSEFKTSRAILLSNLSGDCAFRTEDQKAAYREKYRRKKDEVSE